MKFKILRQLKKVHVSFYVYILQWKETTKMAKIDRLKEQHLVYVKLKIEVFGIKIVIW